MRAEIILVGDELLEDMHGVQPDYMADLLREMGSDLTVRGYTLGRLTCVGDAPRERFEWTEGPTGFGARLLLDWLGGPEPLAGVRT